MFLKNVIEKLFGLDIQVVGKVIEKWFNQKNYRSHKDKLFYLTPTGFFHRDQNTVGVKLLSILQ